MPRADTLLPPAGLDDEHDRDVTYGEERALAAVDEMREQLWRSAGPGTSSFPAIPVARPIEADEPFIKAR
ncbi:MAG: hypothetical protein JWP97_197 [Labilithrix sp.]|nr:hypothetical protein [Labilithrix sp.]